MEKRADENQKSFRTARFFEGYLSMSVGLFGTAEIMKSAFDCGRSIRR
jgi:hypothetical protein